MATYNGIYRVLNSEGTYDTINLRTTAEQVVESSTKRFVTDSEKSTWNNKANASHSHTSSQITDATNANTANMIVKRDASGNFAAGTITANLSGNATTATTLQTARTINGASFNGSANITTTTWGTSRTITIGSKGKSVNGSANVSWTLDEIGAAPTSHTHNYAGSSSAGGAANSAVKLQTARTITLGNQMSGSSTFDGSANITINASLKYIDISSGNLNTYTTDGLYRCISQGNSNNVTNKPIDTADAINGFVLEVKRLRNVSDADANVEQTFTFKNRVWKRLGTMASSGTTWDSWREMVFADGSISGNAGSATKLQTSRTINGTSFNGTGNITTANWGTARNITIGNSKKSVNGSADVSWSLDEIGAATSGHTHNYAGSSSAGGAANSAVKLSSSRTIALSGDATGSASFDGSANATITTTLANSGVTAGSYGPTGNATASFGGTISIPQVTVDAKGRVTSASARTITLPSNPNSDTKVTNTLNTTTKAYITGTTSATTNTGGQIFDTGVYLDTTEGTLTATTFKGALDGNAKTATTATTATTCSGNAATATKLQNTRKINGVAFDGTKDITITANPNAHTHAHTDITGLGTAATKDVGTSSGQIPILGSNGKLANSVLPSIAINDTHTVDTVNAALSLSCEVGDIVIITSYVQPASIEEYDLSEDTQRALNTGSNTFICIKSSATTFDEKFKVLMSSSDAVTHAEFNTALNNKVDKVSGKGLSTNDYTTTEKNKLAGIASNANNYVHPSTHDASMITQSASYRFVTDAEKTKWNSKSDAHSHPYVPTAGGSVTGNIIFNNNVGVQGKNTSGTVYTLAKVNSSNQAYLGTESLPTVLASSANPKARVGSNEYTIYHTGNKPSANDVGAYSKGEADGRYRLKTDLVFTDTIQILTPAT